MVLYLKNMTRLLYHGPRPFWISPEIEALDCANDFGNPSFHSVFVFNVVVLTWMDRDAPKNAKSFAWLAGGLFICFTIAYSRSLVGVHTFD